MSSQIRLPPRLGRFIECFKRRDPYITSWLYDESCQIMPILRLEASDMDRLDALLPSLKEALRCARLYSYRSAICAING